jgi:hypothetical protein
VKAKLAVLATLIGCCGSLAAMSPVASAATPKLCETSCGGSWGAKEHAKAFAEQHGFINVYVSGCSKTSEYGAQWRCSGGGWHRSQQTWTVWMDAYGYEKHWTESI